MKNIPIILFLLSIVSGCAAGSDGKAHDTSTVRELDVERFMGKWHEIARYDHRFERGMTQVTATYSLTDEGKIQVQNSGYKDGKYKQAKAKAKMPDVNDPGKLKVSFFLWFYSDYYIFEIDPEYTYAVIGSSSDKYLWIMSRTETLPDTVLDGILDRLSARGYDTQKLLFAY